MSWCDRRAALAVLGAGLAGACGFRPLHGDRGVGANLSGQISLQAARDPLSFAFRERLRRRLGDSGADARYRLLSLTRTTEEGIAITRSADITRFNVTGLVEWRLVETATGRVALEGAAKSASAYNATASLYATRAARQAAEERVATELAELVATRILSSAEDLSSS